MKVSIITPCYNSARYLDRTIQSVREQTISDWEYIIVDDGSTDNPEVVAIPYQQDARIRFVRQKNGGVSNARNNGYALASPESEYLLFLDADDELHPTMLQEMTAYLDSHSDVGLVYCKPEIIDEHGQDVPGFIDGFWVPRFVPTTWGMRKLSDSYPETPFCTLYAQSTILPSVSLIRHSVYAQTQGFDEKFGHVYEDLDLFLQVALKSKVHFINHSVVRYRRHGTQSTSNQDRIHLQGIKLVEKWAGIMSNASGAEKRKIAQGHHFFNMRYQAITGWQVGMALLQKRESSQAIRYLGGAMKRYILSLFMVASYKS